MDNFVMITAGDAIDSTFGQTLAISTMAAAGFGQCCEQSADFHIVMPRIIVFYLTVYVLGC